MLGADEFVDQIPLLPRIVAEGFFEGGFSHALIPFSVNDQIPRVTLFISPWYLRLER